MTTETFFYCIRDRLKANRKGCKNASSAKRNENDKTKHICSSSDHDILKQHDSQCPPDTISEKKVKRFQVIG